jgi:hypothetical protein
LVYQKNLNKINLMTSRKVTNGDRSGLYLPPKDSEWLICFWQQVWPTPIIIGDLLVVVGIISSKFFYITGGVIIEILVYLEGIFLSLISPHWNLWREMRERDIYKEKTEKETMIAHWSSDYNTVNIIEKILTRQI